MEIAEFMMSGDPCHKKSFDKLCYIHGSII